MSNRVRENSFSAVVGALWAFLVYTYNFVDSHLSWHLSAILHPEMLERYVKGLIATSSGGAALAGYYRDRLSGRESETVVREVIREPVYVEAPEVETSRQRKTLRTKPIDLALLKDEITREEGIKYEVYLDSKDNPTLGVGHLILVGDPEYGKPPGTPVSKERVYSVFSSDVANAIEDARKLVNDFDALPQKAKHVLVQMVFQMGYSSVKNFKQTRRYLNAGQWELAADEMLDSDWYRRDTPARAMRMSNVIRNLSTPDLKLA